MSHGLFKVCELREAKGYSLRQLAEKVGMSYVTLFRLATGETDPRLGKFRRIAKTLNVNVA
jgi:transcriptional regulator with XRE-family HTH domain